MTERPPIKPLEKNSDLQPERFNPELAQIAIIQDILRKSGPLTIISKEHSVQVGYHEMLMSQFYIDTRLTLGVLRSIGAQSVHVNGKLFDETMRFLQKVNWMIQGFGNTMSPFTEESPGIGQRIKNFFGIGKKEGER